MIMVKTCILLLNMMCIIMEICKLGSSCFISGLGGCQRNMQVLCFAFYSSFVKFCSYN